MKPPAHWRPVMTTRLPTLADRHPWCSRVGCWRCFHRYDDPYNCATASSFVWHAALWALYRFDDRDAFFLLARIASLLTGR